MCGGMSYLQVQGDVVSHELSLLEYMMLVNSVVLGGKNFRGPWWQPELLESSAAPPGPAVKDWGRWCWGPGPMACMHPALEASCKYMCIGKGQGQQQRPGLTVGKQAALGDEAGSVYAHGWGCL